MLLCHKPVGQSLRLYYEEAVVASNIGSLIFFEVEKDWGV